VGATPETPPRLGPREKRQVVVAVVVRGRLPACLAAWLLTRKVDGRAAGQQHAVHRGRTPPRQPLPAAHWYVCVFNRVTTRFVFLANDCVASFNMKLLSVISFIHPMHCQKSMLPTRRFIRSNSFFNSTSLVLIK